VTRPPVRRARTAGKSGRDVETAEYAAFIRRVLRAYAARVKAGDIEGLAGLAALVDDAKAALQDAIDGLVQQGYTWDEIGRQLGVRRQSAHERFRRPEPGQQASPGQQDAGPGTRPGPRP
jgi:hypothetical protein